jgi:hypothetical protein
MLGEHEAARDAAVTMLRAMDDPAAGAVAAAPASDAKVLLERRMLARLAAEPRMRQRGSAGLAMLHAAVGDRETAIAELEQAVATHDAVLLYVRVHPAFDSLRGDPRLEPLLRRAGV